MEPPRKHCRRVNSPNSLIQVEMKTKRIKQLDQPKSQQSNSTTVAEKNNLSKLHGTIMPMQSHILSMWFKLHIPEISKDINKSYILDFKLELNEKLKVKDHSRFPHISLTKAYQRLKQTKK